jgi:hypothetical protein
MFEYAKNARTNGIKVITLNSQPKKINDLFTAFGINAKVKA